MCLIVPPLRPRPARATPALPVAVTLLLASCVRAACPRINLVECRVANSPFVLDVPAGAQRGFYKPEVIVRPRIGIAYHSIRR